jgi:hypothetical protein
MGKYKPTIREIEMRFGRKATKYTLFDDKISRGICKELKTTGFGKNHQ